MFNLKEHRVVVGGIHDDGRAPGVLGRGAKEARPADVNLFNRLRRGHTSLGDGVREGVQVDGDDFNEGVAELHERGFVFGCVPGHDAGEDLGLEGLDPAVQTLGVAGELGNVYHRHPVLAQKFGRAAGGDDFEAEEGEALRESQDSGLVRYADEGVTIFLLHCFFFPRLGRCKGALATNYHNAKNKSRVIIYQKSP